MRVTQILLLGVPFLGGAAIAASRGPGGVPECVVARQWVEHNPDALPKTLSAISAYRVAYRKAIFNALPRDVQVRLWHEQFAYYRSAPALSNAQHAFIAEVDGELDDFFGPENADAAYNRYVGRARTVLGDSLAREVFANLGVSTPESEDAGATTEEGSPIKSCGCNIQHDYCFGGPGCGPLVCQTALTGCGTFWCESCDGICR